MVGHLGCWHGPALFGAQNSAKPQAVIKSPSSCRGPRHLWHCVRPTRRVCFSMVLTQCQSSWGVWNLLDGAWSSGGSVQHMAHPIPKAMCWTFQGQVEPDKVGEKKAFCAKTDSSRFQYFLRKKFFFSHQLCQVPPFARKLDEEEIRSDAKKVEIGGWHLCKPARQTTESKKN